MFNFPSPNSFPRGAALILENIYPLPVLKLGEGIGGSSMSPPSKGEGYWEPWTKGGQGARTRHPRASFMVLFFT